jgi:hypothetical protein
MSIEVDTVEGPAHWASYLINGDASSFDYYDILNYPAGARDKARCDAWLDTLARDGWYVVSTEDDSEPEFRDTYLPGIGRFAGDVVTYVLHRRPR